MWHTRTHCAFSKEPFIIPSSGRRQEIDWLCFLLIISNGLKSDYWCRALFGTLNWSLASLLIGPLQRIVFMFQNVLHLNFTTYFSGAALFDTVQFNLRPKQRETANATTNLCRTSLQRGIMNPIWIAQWISAVVAVNLFQYLQLTLASLDSSGFLLYSILYLQTQIQLVLLMTKRRRHAPLDSGRSRAVMLLGRR